MKAMITFLFILSGLSVSAQAFIVPQNKQVWARHKMYHTYTAIFISIPRNEPWFPKCADFNIDTIKKYYTLNVKQMKAKYPNARFREVVLQYPPKGTEVELTFDQFKEIICKP